MVQKTVSFSPNGQRRREISTENTQNQCFLNLAILWTCIALCTIVHPVSANPISDSPNMKVSDLSFSEKLSNPCDLVDASALNGDSLTQESKRNTRRDAIIQMKAKASLLKENAETVLRTNVLRGCSSLEMPSVAEIPSVVNRTDNVPLDVLRLFYTSLLNHTAHVYFISEQQQRHSRDDACNNPDLSTNTKSLASQMQDLMCVLRFSILTLEQDNDEDDSFGDSTDQILNEQLSDPPLCSRRSFRDCQTVNSTVTLLRELSEYLQTTVLFDDTDSNS